GLGRSPRSLCAMRAKACARDAICRGVKPSGKITRNWCSRTTPMVVGAVVFEPEPPAASAIPIPVARITSRTAIAPSLRARTRFRETFRGGGPGFGGITPGRRSTTRDSSLGGGQPRARAEPKSSAITLTSGQALPEQALSGLERLRKLLRLAPAGAGHRRPAATAAADDRRRLLDHVDRRDALSDVVVKIGDKMNLP